MRFLCAFLLVASFCYAQTAPKPSQLPSAPSPSSPSPKAANEAKEVAPTAPVITLNGFCPGKQATGADCKTFVTRDQFEKLAKALGAPENMRPQLANAYAQALILGGKAEERGLTNKPETQEILQFVRLQTLARVLANDVQQQAANVPQSELQQYYDEHKDQFAQATLQRIFIPKSAGKEKVSESTLKAEADKIDAAAKAAGADFTKLQKQAYDDLKITTAPPPVDLRDMRRDSLPPAQQQKVFSLATGAVSEPIDEPSAIYIYKLVAKNVPPLTQVEAEVKRTLEQQRFQADMEKMLSGVKPELNQAYFSNGAAEGRPEPSGAHSPVTPAGSPASKTPASAPKGPSSPPKK